MTQVEDKMGRTGESTGMAETTLAAASTCSSRRLSSFSTFAVEGISFCTGASCGAPALIRFNQVNMRDLDVLFHNLARKCLRTVKVIFCCNLRNSGLDCLAL